MRVSACHAQAVPRSRPSARRAWQGRRTARRRDMTQMFEMRCREKRHRAQAHQDQASLDQWAGRTHEPDDQGSDRQTLPLRLSRPARKSPRDFIKAYNYGQRLKTLKGLTPLRIHLQSLDFRTKSLRTQSAPSNARTRHLVEAHVAGTTPLQMRDEPSQFLHADGNEVAVSIKATVDRDFDERPRRVRGRTLKAVINSRRYR